MDAYLPTAATHDACEAKAGQAAEAATGLGALSRAAFEPWGGWIWMRMGLTD